MNAPRRHAAPQSPAPAAVRPLAPVPPGVQGSFDWLKKGLGALAVLAGGTLAAFGALGVMVGVVQSVSPDEGKKVSEGVLILLIAGVFVGVGWFLWQKGMAPFRNARRREQLLGFIRAQVRIRASDVATRFSLAEAEAEALLTSLIARGEADLVYLPDARQYVHREAAQQGQGVARRCPSCDAPVGAQGVLPGDKLVCSYCDAPFAA